MAFGFSRIPVTPIAIDCGGDRIKLLQLTRPTGDEPPQVIAAGAEAVPEPARADLASRMSFAQSAVKRLLRKHAFRGRKAVFALPAAQTLVQHLDVTCDEHEDMTAQIAVQLQQRLGVDPARMVVRHHRVGRASPDGGARQEMICFAAPREMVRRMLELAEHCRLEVVGLHSEPPCLLAAFRQLYNRRQEDREQVNCFIDLGASAAKVVIAHGHDMVFAKHIAIGGDGMTRELARQRQIDFDQARQTRIEQAQSEQVEPASDERRHVLKADTEGGAGRTGLPMLDACADGSTTAVAAPPATEASDEALECLIDELRLCVRYYQGLFPEAPIAKLIFCGGEAQHTQVCQRIARELRIAAQLGDPFARLTLSPDARPPLGIDLTQPQPGWTLPLGLALSGTNIA